MNRFDLFDAMVNGRTVKLSRVVNGNQLIVNEGKIMSIQMEDGSGYSFNLTMSNEKRHSFSVYYRCPK